MFKRLKLKRITWGGKQDLIEDRANEKEKNREVLEKEIRLWWKKK